VTALVLRDSRDEMTWAVVSCKRTRLVYSANQLLNRVQAAVSEWVRTTDAGKNVYEDSGGDYNVGDLANDLDDKDLRRCLESQGLFHVDIDVYSYDDAAVLWSFDTHLVDETAEDAASLPPHLTSRRTEADDRE
jgi:hypothetical protein